VCGYDLRVSVCRINPLMHVLLLSRVIIVCGYDLRVSVCRINPLMRVCVIIITCYYRVCEMDPNRDELLL
jgi:hypothetical protein